jgi:hypothetical protein
LLEGVGDRGLVLRAGLLQHVIEHAGPSRGPRGPLRAGSTVRASSSSSPCSYACVRRWGFLTFFPRFCFFAESLDLLLSAGVSSVCLPFLPSKIASTASSPEVKLVAISNSSLESTSGLLPS